MRIATEAEIIKMTQPRCINIVLIEKGVAAQIFSAKNDVTIVRMPIYPDDGEWVGHLFNDLKDGGHQAPMPGECANNGVIADFGDRKV